MYRWQLLFFQRLRLQMAVNIVVLLRLLRSIDPYGHCKMSPTTKLEQKLCN